MDVEIETTATPAPRDLWLDVDGFAGSVKPGNGPRRDPKGDVRTLTPDIGHAPATSPAPSMNGTEHLKRMLERRQPNDGTQQ